MSTCLFCCQRLTIEYICDPHAVSLPVDDNDRSIVGFVMAGHAKLPDQDFLHQKLAKELRGYDQLRHNFNRYDEAEPGDREFSYAYLYAAMEKVLLRERKKKARNEEAQHLVNQK